MPKWAHILIRAAVGCLVLSSAVAGAKEAKPPSCADFIDANPFISGQTEDPVDDSEHIDAWFEPPNDSLYVHIDGKRFENVEQLGKRMAGAQTDLFILYDADFAGWDFTKLGAPTQGLCFYRSRLNGSNWNGLNIDRSAFVESDLSGASFRGATMQRVLLHDVRLEKTDMRGADLSFGRLSGGWFADLSMLPGGAEIASGLNGWKLQGANLSLFRFECFVEIHNGCPLDRQIDFREANLAGAELAQFAGWGEFWLHGANINATTIAPNQLVYFREASITGPVVLTGKDQVAIIQADEARQLIPLFLKADVAKEGPAFDCNRARTQVERMICSEQGGQENLHDLDRRMAQAYAAARRSNTASTALQKQWLKSRDKCADYACLVTSYERQISIMMGLAGPPEWIGKGQSALFIGGEPSVLDHYADTPFWKRLVPVLADSANERVIVTRAGDGSWSVQGRALGANAHACYLDAYGLEFDKRNGWFALRSSDGPQLVPVFRIVGRELEVLGDGHPDRKAFPESDFVSCGARASFGRALHLKLAQQDIALLLKGMEN